MKIATPPRIEWHGKDDYGYRNVALQGTVGRFVQSLSAGVEFTAEEVTQIIKESVEQDIVHRDSSEEYDPDLSMEMARDGDELGAVKNCLDSYVRPVDWQTYSNQKQFMLEYANPAYYVNTSTEYQARYDRSLLDTSVYRRVRGE